MWRNKIAAAVLLFSTGMLLSGCGRVRQSTGDPGCEHFSVSNRIMRYDSSTGRYEFQEEDKSDGSERPMTANRTDEFIRNPYFYDKDEVSLQAKAKYFDGYFGGGLVEKNVYIRVDMLQTYEEGSVYKFTVDMDDDVDERDFYRDQGWLDHYFYVTKDRIYSVMSASNLPDMVFDLNDNADILAEIYDTDEKLIEWGTIVCQEDEMIEDRESVYRSITKTGNQITYNESSIKANGDIGWSMYYTWKQGEGLISCGFRRGPGEGYDLILDEIRNCLNENFFPDSKWREMPDIEVPYMPELGYRESLGSQYYVCWKDLLVIGEVIYKREDGIYKRTGERLLDWLQTDANIIKQCENLLIALDDRNEKIGIYDMDTSEWIREYPFKGVDFKVYNGEIYYNHTDYNHADIREEIRRMDPLSGESKLVSSNGGWLMMRDNGDMIFWNRNEGTSDILEFWMLSHDEQESSCGKKLWEAYTEFIWPLDYNDRGLFFLREYYAEGGRTTDFVCLTDDGKAEKIVWKEWALLDGLMIVDEGYFLLDSQRLSEKERLEILWDYSKDEEIILAATDSISYYDFQGNRLKTWRLIEDEMLDAGYRLVYVVYDNGEIYAFYDNEEIDDLYISKIQVWEEAFQEEQSGPKEQKKSLTLSIDENGIDLLPLGSLEELEALNLNIQDGCSPDLSFMEDLSQLRKLDITVGGGVDLRPLGELKGLQQLSISTWSGDALDLSFLERLSCVEEITIMKCCEVSDLSLFQNMPFLRKLNVSYVEDGDLCYLANLNNLESLVIIGGDIRNPEGISNLTHLKSLSLYDNSSETLYGEAERTPFDVQSIAGLTELEWLDLSFLYIEDVSPLTNLKELRHIELIRTSVEDISPLEELRNLDEIFIFGNQSELVEEQSAALFDEVETVIVTEEMPIGL